MKTTRPLAALLGALFLGVAMSPLASAAIQNVRGTFTVDDLCDYACISEGLPGGPPEGFYGGGFGNSFLVGDQFAVSLKYEDAIIDSGGGTTFSTFAYAGTLTGSITRIGGAGTYSPSASFSFTGADTRDSLDRLTLFYDDGDLPVFPLPFLEDMIPFRTSITVNSPGLVVSDTGTGQSLATQLGGATFESGLATGTGRMAFEFSSDSSLGTFAVRGTFTPIPEPSSLVLGGIALIGCLLRRKH